MASRGNKIIQAKLETFIRAKKWVEELKRKASPNLVMALVANKSDLESRREVKNDDGEQFSKENGMFFMETSAKTALNINELFYETAKRLTKANPIQPIGMNIQNEGQRRFSCCLG